MDSLTIQEMSAAKETPDVYGLKAKIRADKKKININLTNYVKAFKNIQTKVILMMLLTYLENY
jgi:hypothetical protein